MAAPHGERVLSFADALATVLEHARALPQNLASELVPLAQAPGRVLAAPIHAERDQPPFARSTRDGYAVRTADLASPVRVIGSLRAGEVPTGPPLGIGEALEIMTGAPVPSTADAVLMFEHAVLSTVSSENAGSTEFLQLAPGRTLAPGENVVPRASEARAGAELIPTGRRVAAPEVALAASCGFQSFHVYQMPRVAIVATGDELVELDATPESWQIRNSNSHALKALVTEAGGFGGPLPIARDTLSDLRERIAQGSMWDLLLLSGGVSMGKYDLVEQVLREFGAEFFFTGALIQPGKPIVFGRLPKSGVVPSREPSGEPSGKPSREPSGEPSGELNVEASEEPSEGAVTYHAPWDGDWTYFFGLPGNPVSTEVCFRLFVAPLLRALAGQIELAPRFVEAQLAKDVRGGARVTRFLPAILTSDWQSARVELVPWQGSGDLAANARANCFTVLPIGPDAFAAGSAVRVLLR